MPDPLKTLSITNVRTAVPAGVGTEAGQVTLIEDTPPYRTLEIVMGQPEARAIQAAWQARVPPRPSTWDLFVSTVAILGGRIDRVVITAVEERRHFYAQLELDRDGQAQSLSCRPSDAIALAIRSAGASILCRPEVLDAAGVLPENSSFDFSSEPSPPSFEP